MSSDDDLPQRDRWARLRYAIIGPLLAAPPADGELSAALNVLAAKTWRHPFTGLDMRFGCSTLERWFYAARRAKDPVLALRNRVRRDIGRFPSLSADAVRELTAQYHQHPSWAAKLHSDNLRVVLVALRADAPCPSYASVRRVAGTADGTIDPRFGFYSSPRAARVRVFQEHQSGDTF